MLNDILFCLLGYTGGTFQDIGSGFVINETIDCISNSEKELLRKIGEIGFKYKILKDFVRSYQDLFNQKLMKGGSLFGGEDEEESQEIQEISNKSIYLSPVCASLNNYLKEYESEIHFLESKYYHNLILTGSEIISHLEGYSIIFDKIYEFLQFITQKNLKGGEFLNFLHESTITGGPETKSTFKNFFINTNKILISNITFWIINGTISNNEFFISSANNFIVKEDGLSKNANSFTYYDTSGRNELESWNANYYVEYSNIPVYLPHSFAEDILFVGKALKILNSNKNADEDKIPFNDISIFYTSLQKLNQIVFNQEEDTVNIINIELLSKVITLIKNCSAKYLWKLVVNKKGFFDHLSAVKNIFLTFNGEFFFNFVIKIKKLLNVPFDKKIEQEINEVYFKNSMKEVFNTDTDPNNEKLYSNFKIKLISSGFNYNFETANVKNYLGKKEISFIGSINFDSYSNSLRFMNTTYKTLPGALWNLTSYDVDEEFTMSNNFIIKNFTKPRDNLGGGNVLNSNTGSQNQNASISPRLPLISPRLNRTPNLDNDLLRSSLIKGRKQSEVNDDFALERKITLNYIMHLSKNFEYKNSQPLYLNDLFHYFVFQFTITYEFSQKSGSSSNNLSTTKPKALAFSLKYINKLKKIILDNSNSGNNQNNNGHVNYNANEILNLGYTQITHHEIEIFAKKMYENLEFLNNDQLTNLQFTFKDNFCTIFNENKTLNFSFPFSINQFIPRDKRKMTIGLIINSENLDIIFDIVSWHFNFYSGEIYNENSNLILISYNPIWPHNFLFNENILKMYNLIFNLIFPLKTNLILLNQLWIEKKNLAKKENFLFRLVDSVHSEFVCFLQNLISFYMFDLIDIKFKTFFSKIKDCQDFEQIIISHEEFLGEVIAHSFVKSKKIMRVIFDILFTTRKFYNYIENLLSNLYSQQFSEEEIVNKEQYEVIKANLMGIKEEFDAKVKNLIFIFTKIKNSKYFTIISQLLTKLDYHQKEMNNNGLVYNY